MDLIDRIELQEERNDELRAERDRLRTDLIEADKFHMATAKEAMRLAEQRDELLADRDRLREALATLTKEAGDVLMDHAQDEIEDPCGHADRKPWARIHENAVETLKPAVAAARAALSKGTP